jgi:hypothetical protein
MSDDKILTGGSEGDTPEATDGGKNGRQVSGFDAFKSSGKPVTPNRTGASSPGGKGSSKKSKIARPKKALVPMDDSEVDDPEMEAARSELEECLIELLVTSTDSIADGRYAVLVKKFPEAEARGLADKARLTEKEKEFFGKLAVRLWRKYLGDDYIFSDETIAGIYFIRYMIRNAEGLKQAKAIIAEEDQEKKNGATKKGADQQPRLQSPPRFNPGSQPVGEVHARQQVNLQPSGPAHPGL